ncbi:MAG: hypothetical protein Q9197_004015 [Variospora fuerteventurae]
MLAPSVPRMSLEIPFRRTPGFPLGLDERGKSSPEPSPRSQPLSARPSSPSRPGPQEVVQANRTQEFALPPSLPLYECRISRRYPGQMKAQSWLKQPAGAYFSGALRALLAGWGVTPQHTGTCVLILEDQRHSQPLDLIAFFTG